VPAAGERLGDMGSVCTVSVLAVAKRGNFDWEEVSFNNLSTALLTIPAKLNFFLYINCIFVIIKAVAPQKMKSYRVSLTYQEYCL
jgi:hypothetical protein